MTCLMNRSRAEQIRLKIKKLDQIERRGRVTRKSVLMRIHLRAKLLVAEDQARKEC